MERRISGAFALAVVLTIFFGVQLQAQITGTSIPAMTQTEIDNLTDPVAGFIVFNTTDGELQVNTGTSGSPVWSQIVTSTVPYTMPAADGDDGQVLTTDGAGNLSWTTQKIVVRKTADESTSSTSKQDDDDLFVDMEANATYVFKVALFVDENDDFGNEDIEFDFTFPPGTTLAAGYQGLLTLGTMTGGGNGNSGVPRTSDTYVEITGIVITGGTPGTLQLRWSKANGGGTEVTVRENSFMTVTPM